MSPETASNKPFPSGELPPDDHFSVAKLILEGSDMFSILDRVGAFIREEWASLVRINEDAPVPDERSFRDILSQEGLRELPGMLVSPDQKAMEKTFLSAHLKIALNFLKSGEIDRALAIFCGVLLLDPTNTAALSSSIVAIEMANQGAPENKDAVVLRRSEKPLPADLGDTYASIGNYEQAIYYYTKAIDGDPQKPELYRKRAIAKEALRQTGAARFDRETAERLKGGESIQLPSEGGDLSLRLRVREAVATGTPAAEAVAAAAVTQEKVTQVLQPGETPTVVLGEKARSPSSYQTILDRGIEHFLALATGPQQALQDLQKAVQLLKEGKIEEADTICKETLSQNPNNAWAAFGCGLVCHAMAIKTEPVDPAYLQKAQSFYAQAVELARDNPVFLSVWENIISLTKTKISTGEIKPALDHDSTRGTGPLGKKSKPPSLPAMNPGETQDMMLVARVITPFKMPAPKTVESTEPPTRMLSQEELAQVTRRETRAIPDEEAQLFSEIEKLSTYLANPTLQVNLAHRKETLERLVIAYARLTRAREIKEADPTSIQEAKKGWTTYKQMLEKVFHLTPEQTVQRCRDILAPENIEGLSIAAKALDPLATALKLLKSAQEKKPGSLRITLAIGDIYFALKQYTESQRYYTLPVMRRNGSMTEEDKQLVIPRLETLLAAEVLSGEELKSTRELLAKLKSPGRTLSGPKIKKP